MRKPNTKSDAKTTASKNGDLKETSRPKKIKKNSEREADQKKVNAFQVMMDSRRHIIGSNSAGKFNVDEEQPKRDKDVKHHRKQFLEKWAEDKGSKEKVTSDENRRRHLDEKLQRRKKKFTKMLTAINVDDNDDDDDFESVRSPVACNILSFIKPKPECDQNQSNVLKVKIAPKKLKSKLNKRHKRNESSQSADVDEIVKPTPTEDTSQVCRKRKSRRVVKYAESTDDDDDADDSDLSVIMVMDESCKENVGVKTISPIKIVNINSTVDIKCVKSPKSVPLGRGPAEKKIKIAPLFSRTPSFKREPLSAARQSFLYGENPNKIINEKCPENISYRVPLEILIPTVSHVQQISKSDDDSSFDVWSLPFITSTILEDFLEEKSPCTVEESIVYKHKVSNLKTNDNHHNIFSRFMKFEILKDGINHLKTHYPNFPVYKSYRQLKNKLKCHKRNADVSENTESILWVDKYKPSSSDDIIGNFGSVANLKKWLCSWKDCGDILNKNRNSESSDDFYSSDSDDNVVTLPDNVMLITGPHGSGKTSSVYAIAKELDMNVIEIHASSKRSGKVITTVLQEATQSHKVVINSETKNIKPAKKKLETKRKKLVKKEKLINFKNTDSKKMSLILIEDADIVFDEDDGFSIAISNIIQCTKRPIVIVASNISCSHLKKFIQDRNVINFLPLSGKIVGPWLDILTLIESKLFLPGFSQYLIDTNKGDMRKTIHQLQFWTYHLLSNDDAALKDFNQKVKVSEVDSDAPSNENNIHANVKLKCSNASSNMDQFFKNMPMEIVKKINYDNMSWKSNKFHLEFDMLFKENTYNDKNDMIQSDKFTLDTCTMLFDQLSFHDLFECNSTLCDTENVYAVGSPPLTDSLSENDRTEEYNNLEYLNEYSHYLLKYIRNEMDTLSISRNAFEYQQTKSRWINKRRMIELQLCDALPFNSQGVNSSLVLDYLPTLRNICRTEKLRSGNNDKRNKRFYHYLNSLNIDELIYDDVCDVLVSKQNAHL